MEAPTADYVELQQTLLMGKPWPTHKTVWKINRTLHVGPSRAYALRGVGGQHRSSSPVHDAYQRGSVIYWTGDAGKPMMVLASASGTVVEGLNFACRQTDKPSSGILITHGHGTLNVAIRDCGFQQLAVGIQCGTHWQEPTCANVTYDNCHFEEMADCCVRLVNAQSLEHLFLRPQFTWSPTALHVQGGGNVTVIGGGSYEVNTLLKLDQIGSNARGFHFVGFRPDGKRTRTTWLETNATREAAYGNVTFDSVSQNHGQQSTDRPLWTIAPGCTVIARTCNFHGRFENLARLRSTTKFPAALHIEHPDGLPESIDQLITMAGPRSAWTRT